MLRRARVLAQGPPLRYLPLASRAAVLPVRALAPFAMEMAEPLPNAALVNKLNSHWQRHREHAKARRVPWHLGVPWRPSLMVPLGQSSRRVPARDAGRSGQVRSGQVYYSAELEV